jgi:1,4-dihydroxy-2-naphthoate octaprenyltransferase
MNDWWGKATQLLDAGLGAFSNYNTADAARDAAKQQARAAQSNAIATQTLTNGLIVVGVVLAAVAGLWLIFRR